MKSELMVLGQDEGHLRAEWRNLYAVVYRSAPSLNQMSPVERECESMRVRFPRGIAVCQIIEGGCGAPDAPMRERSQQLFSNLGRQLTGVVILPEGDGMWASTLRSLMAGFGRVTYMQEVCRSGGEAGRSLEKLMGGSASASEIERTLTEVKLAFPRVQMAHAEARAFGRF